MDADQQQYMQEQEFGLYDEDGKPREFLDQDGNVIPFEEVQQIMMMQQQ